MSRSTSRPYFTSYWLGNNLDSNFKTIIYIGDKNDPTKCKGFNFVGDAEKFGNDDRYMDTGGAEWHRLLMKLRRCMMVLSLLCSWR